MGLYNMLTAFVCGFEGACDCVGYHAKPCSEEELKEAVQIGKNNLSHNFQMFGLVEHWEKSLRMFETVFPRLEVFSEITIENERSTKRHLGLPKNPEQLRELEHILW